MPGWYLTEGSRGECHIGQHMSHPEDTHSMKSNIRASRSILMSLTSNEIGRVSRTCLNSGLKGIE